MRYYHFSTHRFSPWIVAARISAPGSLAYLPLTGAPLAFSRLEGSPAFFETHLGVFLRESGLGHGGTIPGKDVLDY